MGSYSLISFSQWKERRQRPLKRFPSRSGTEKTKLKRINFIEKRITRNRGKSAKGKEEQKHVMTVALDRVCVQVWRGLTLNFWCFLNWSLCPYFGKIAGCKCSFLRVKVRFASWVSALASRPVSHTRRGWLAVKLVRGFRSLKKASGQSRSSVDQNFQILSTRTWQFSHINLQRMKTIEVTFLSLQSFRFVVPPPPPPRNASQCLIIRDDFRKNDIAYKIRRN